MLLRGLLHEEVGLHGAQKATEAVRPMLLARSGARADCARRRDARLICKGRNAVSVDLCRCFEG